MVVHCAGSWETALVQPPHTSTNSRPGPPADESSGVAERLRDALSEGLAGYGYGSAGIGGGGHEGEKPHGLR